MNTEQVNTFGFKMKKSQSTAVILNKDINVGNYMSKKSSRLPPKPPANDALIKKDTQQQPLKDVKPQKTAIRPQTFYASFKEQLKEKKTENDEIYKQLYSQDETKENTNTKNSAKKSQVWRNLSSGATSTGSKRTEKKPMKRPPSSARWADLSRTKGMYPETKQKIKDMTLENNRQKSADLSHLREFKNLSAVLAHQKKSEEQAKKRLEHLYGADSELTKKYNQEEFERRKRD